MGKPDQEAVMLCQDCVFREVCQSPCASLEQDLSRFDYYQRELIVSPEKLEHLAVSLIQLFNRNGNHHTFLDNKLMMVVYM